MVGGWVGKSGPSGVNFTRVLVGFCKKLGKLTVFLDFLRKSTQKTPQTTTLWVVVCAHFRDSRFTLFDPSPWGLGHLLEGQKRHLSLGGVGGLPDQWHAQPQMLRTAADCSMPILTGV